MPLPIQSYATDPPFVAKITAIAAGSGSWSGINLYTWTEQYPNVATALYADAPSGRSGAAALNPMLELNNIAVGVFPFFAWARFKGVLFGQPTYEFNADSTTTPPVVSTPAQITSDQDNYDPGTADILRLSTDTTRTITGIAGGYPGRLLTLVNVGTSDLIVSNQNSSSTDVNRVIGPYGGDVLIKGGRTAELIYDGTTQRWRPSGGPALMEAPAGNTITIGAATTRTGTDTLGSGYAGTLQSGATLTMASGSTTARNGTDTLGSTYAGTMQSGSALTMASGSTTTRNGTDTIGSTYAGTMASGAALTVSSGATLTHSGTDTYTGTAIGTHASGSADTYSPGSTLTVSGTIDMTSATVIYPPATTISTFGGVPNNYITTAMVQASAITSAKVDSTVIIAAGTNPFTGDQSMGSHKLTSVTDPVSAQDAATKNYVDAVAQGLTFKPTAQSATTTTLPTYTYLAGVITFTATGTETIDGHLTAVNERVLVKNETGGNKPYNGLYKITTAGAGGVAGIWTRDTAMDASAEFGGAVIAVESGTANADTIWVCATNSPTVGTTDISIVPLLTPGAGTVTTVSVVTANGVSGSVANATTTPAITLTLGDITPSSVAATGGVSGTTWIGTDAITATLTNSTTTNTDSVLTLNHNSSGTPAAGFGTRITFGLQSSTTTGRIAGWIEYLWATATDASRKSRMVMYAQDASAQREFLRGESDGSHPMIGFLGAAATAAQASPDIGSDYVTRGLASGTPTFAAANLTGLVPSANLPYLCYEDQKTSGTAGGTFTSGAWQTRVLNTEVIDTGNNGSVASNQLTLVAGTYRVRAHCVAGFVNSHQVRLQNVTDSTTILTGTSEYASSTNTDWVGTRSFVEGQFTIAGSKAIELQHKCQTTKATNGFGVAGSFGTEVYSRVELWRVG